MPELRLKSVGEGCKIYGGSEFYYSENLALGKNVHIMPGCFLNARGGITIGDNTHLARRVTIYSYSHNYNGVALPYDDTAIEKPVAIGRNCWIGMNVNIIPGITIGEGAIIQLGATVAEDVPALAIYGASRGHVIKYRDEKHYRRLDQEGAFGGVNGVPIFVTGENEVSDGQRK